MNKFASGPMLASSLLKSETCLFISPTGTTSNLPRATSLIPSLSGRNSTGSLSKPCGFAFRAHVGDCQSNTQIRAWVLFQT
mmetsp:Transcript_33616/g.46556  ORF Transcript_33616/g.46556 Transcript_33616/m.46556 type:complete len:81 (+) Transcript_33616:913-1155(+)